VKKMPIHLEQVQAGDMLFDQPVEIGNYKAGSATPVILKMRLDKKRMVQSFSVVGAPEKVEMDPRNLLLSKNDFSKKAVSQF
jgi:hypothetical protein